MLAVELIILFVLILFNGFMAMSELAVVSARPARLKARRDKGERGAARALALSSDPGRFLSTVQIGITLVGILSGAFSGATLGVRLSDTLAALGVPPSVASPAGIGIVVALITYVSLIIGELVPKQIALKNADGIAVKVAPVMVWIARIAMPLVWLLDISGRTVLALLGQSSQPASYVTDEEIRTLIAEAEHAGTIESGERRMITGVMRLADRKARAIMTPRGEVDWVDLTADEEAIVDVLRRTDHSLLPAGKGSMNALTGVIRIRDISIADIRGKALGIADRVHPAPLVHDNTPALDVLTLLREAEVPMVLVHDEFGTFEGVVTPADILEAIAGVFRADAEEGELDIIQRDDGSWLLPGMMPADEMADHLGISLPPDRSYSTLAGFLLTHFQELPKTGSKAVIQDWRFEIVDMDGRRIDQVIASRLEPAEVR
ncbi:hemolysin family protein [Nitratireductor thuwali]|uniref:Magnesium and cobalt efflux protein CorC n=1 Tax=Nitratireductor thuwali TaxID=2267699 RepID=A0ABY5MHR4_9HYPH|nr:Magnesium and cobalt efflux protein CorC [Nitratireductor thuwali]